MKDLTMKIEPIVDRDSLNMEKIQLAKELGRIDKRLSEIDIALGSIGTRYNDRAYVDPNVEPKKPEPPPFTIVGQFSNEVLEELYDKSWPDIDNPDMFMCAVFEGTTVYPAKSDMHTYSTIIEEGKSWRVSQLFRLETMALYNLVSTHNGDIEFDKRQDYKNFTFMAMQRKSFYFIEQIRAGYTGFFVAKEDVKILRVP